MPPYIRAAGLSDVPAVEALARQCLPDTDDFLQLTELFHAPSQILRLHVLLVAFDEENSMVGYAFFSPFIDFAQDAVDLTTAVLNHIGVDPQSRGEGVARELEKEGLSRLRTVGYRRVVAKVTADGKVLLRNLGWKVLRKGQTHTWLAAPHGRDMEVSGPATRFRYEDRDRPVAVRHLYASEQQEASPNEGSATG